jgi:GTPase SAR1 family protein
VDEFLIRYRHAVTELGDRTLAIRRWLGYASQDTAAPVARSRASDYLNETERRLDQLPLIYKTLFSLDPVTDPRYLKGRDRDLLGLNQGHERWMKGLFTSTVLVGEEGSGKTSLLNRFLSTTLADTEVVRIVIPQTITTEGQLLTVLKDGFGMGDADGFATLLQALRDGPRRHVVVEGLQKLYLRHMSGFAAMDRFLLFVAESASSVFWLVTCTRYAWNYLDDSIQISASFTDEIHTDRMSAHDIRDAIMSRHRVSGYRAVFTPSETERRSRAYKKLLHDEEARQQFLEVKYFQDMAKWCRGNVKIAILFWLRTIRGFETDTFTIEPVSADLIELGDAFSLDDLFAITAILQHHDIQVDELARNQNRSITECRMTLTRLHARRILNETDGRYTLNSVLLRPLTLRLQSKNILH